MNLIDSLLREKEQNKKPLEKKFIILQKMEQTTFFIAKTVGREVFDLRKLKLSVRSHLNKNMYFISPPQTEHLNTCKKILNLMMEKLFGPVAELMSVRKNIL